MRYLLIAVLTSHSFISFGSNMNDVNLKISEYDYFDFIDEYGLDDTSIVIIDLFLRKRIEQGVGEMSFLPITVAVSVVVPPIGIALTAIALPLTVHGSYVYMKYSKKRLAKVLEKYSNNKQLSKGLMKKIKKHYQVLENESLMAQTYGG